MAAGRRGRPYQVPEDTTSVRASTIDVHARVGWLLLMSRLHHPDPELALGDSFNAALRAVGVQADRSAVSRWESGKAAPRYSVLVGYERVLGLPEGQLTSVVNAQRREFGGDDLASWAPVLDAQSTEFHERLDALVDALLEGPGTGPQWTALAQHVAATHGMYVHGSVWRHLSTALINQLTRSVGAAYLERMEAVRLLLGHQIAEPWLLRATDEFLDDPAVQVVNDPMGVLEISTAPQAAEVVLDKMLTTRSPQVLTAAVAAVAVKIQRGSYTTSQLEQIEQSVVSRLQGPNASAAVFEELTLVMSEAASERLLVASRGVTGHEELATVAAHGELVDPGVARRVSQRIAQSACAQLPACRLYEEDKMTPRLVREALFSGRSVLAHYASLALQGSPFRGPVAAALVGEVKRYGVDDPLAARFSRLLRYLAGADQEESLLGWLPKAPPAVARDLGHTLGHIDSRRQLEELPALLRGDDSVVDRALLYGLGMRQARALAGLAEDANRPAPVREAAQWWLRQGGAVRV